MSNYPEISLWHETAGDTWEPRPALMGDVEVDVAIVGAGYTGLWTAYYLAEARPDLKIAVLEAEVAGFGASGRNGGWCSALFPASLDKVAAGSNREAALAQDRAMRATVDEVIRVAGAEGIEADIAKGGTVVVARTAAQLERARDEVEHARSWGLGDAEISLLDQAAAEKRLAATGTLGATYTPDCAALHPAKLVRGLARAVEARGVTIYEQTRVTAIEPHLVRSPPTSSYAPQRATPRRWPASSARSSRCAPSSSPPSRSPTWSGRASASRSARRSPTAGTC